jgi:hypothetical protein
VPSVTIEKCLRRLLHRMRPLPGRDRGMVNYRSNMMIRSLSLMCFLFVTLPVLPTRAQTFPSDLYVGGGTISGDFTAVTSGGTFLTDLKVGMCASVIFTYRVQNEILLAGIQASSNRKRADVPRDPYNTSHIIPFVGIGQVMFDSMILFVSANYSIWDVDDWIDDPSFHSKPGLGGGLILQFHRTWFAVLIHSVHAGVGPHPLDLWDKINYHSSQVSFSGGLRFSLPIGRR